MSPRFLPLALRAFDLIGSRLVVGALVVACVWVVVTT